MPRAAVILRIMVVSLASVLMAPVAAKADSELDLLLSNEEAKKSYDECIGLYELSDTRTFEEDEKDKLNTCLATFGEYLLKYPNYLASQPPPDQLMERYDMFYKDGMVKG